MWLGYHFQGQRSKSPGRFTHRGVNASASCSGERGNILAVGTYCHVVVCTLQARSARWRVTLRHPQREERGGGILRRPPAYSSFVFTSVSEHLWIGEGEERQCTVYSWMSYIETFWQISRSFLLKVPDWVIKPVLAVGNRNVEEELKWFYPKGHWTTAKVTKIIWRCLQWYFSSKNHFSFSFYIVLVFQNIFILVFIQFRCHFYFYFISFANPFSFSSPSNSCQSPYQFCSARMFLH